MIEIKITGENANDAANQLLGFANFVAIGVNVVQAQQQQVPSETANATAKEITAEQEEPKAAKATKAAKKAAAPEPEQADIEDVLAEDVVEEVANPVPQNIEQLRELVLKVHTKVGAVEGSRIVQFYAPKISGVPTDKYKELSAKLYAALEG